MGIAEVIAFFKALPQLVHVMGEVVSSLRQLRQDAIDQELDSIKKEVDSNIKILILAKSDDERKKALLDLAGSLRR